MGEEVVLEAMLYPPVAPKGVGVKEKDKNELTQVPVSVGRTSLYVTVIDQKDVIVPIVSKVPVIKAPSANQEGGKDKDSITPHTGIEIEEDFIENGFSEGILFISSAQGIKLRNTDLIGKGDPFVQFQFGTWEARTKTLQNAGGDTIWNELEISTKVTADDLRKEYLIVTVFDENSMRSNQIIGKGEILLKRPANKIGNEIEISIPLNDKNNKSAGRIVLKIMVRLFYSIFADFLAFLYCLLTNIFSINFWICIYSFIMINPD